MHDFNYFDFDGKTQNRIVANLIPSMNPNPQVRLPILYQRFF